MSNRVRNACLAVAIFAMTSVSVNADVTGVWQMDSGQHFVLMQKGNKVDGVFTGNNFGVTLVFGEQTPEGEIQLYGIGASGLMQIRLNYDDRSGTLDGSVAIRQLFRPERSFDFMADRPYEVPENAGEFDGLWALEVDEDSGQISYLVLATIEVRGVPTYYAAEFITNPSGDVVDFDIYTGDVLTDGEDNAIFLFGGKGFIAAMLNGDELFGLRSTYFFDLSSLAGNRTLKIGDSASDAN